MEKKEPIKVSLSTFFLIIAIIVIAVMGYFMYKLYNDKVEETKKATDLQTQVNSLNGTINDLQGKIDTISETINTNKTSENTTNLDKSKDNRKIIEELVNLSSNKDKITIGTKRNTIKEYVKNGDKHFNDDETSSIGYYQLFGNYGKLDYICFGYDSNNIVRDITIYDRGTKDGIGTQGDTTYEEVTNFYKNTENVKTSKEEGVVIVKIENENDNIIIEHDFNNNVLTKIALYI